MIKPYDLATETCMKIYFDSLTEKNKRLYAAVEVSKMPYGGRAYISRLLGCDPKTIDQGVRDLNNFSSLPKDRERRQGGGRKAKTKNEEIKRVFKEVLLDHTAGDPMRDDVKWTDLRPVEIQEFMEKKIV